MSDSNGQGDQNTTPDDIASLYSWANLHGAKYRDFSASRAQFREISRLRVQEATDAERQRIGATLPPQSFAEAQQAEEAELAAEARRQAEWGARHEAESGTQQSLIVAAQWAAQTFVSRPANEPAQPITEPEGHEAAQEAEKLELQAAEERAMKEAAERAAEEADRQATQRAHEEAERQAAQHAAEEAERQSAQHAAEEAERQAEQRAAEEAERQAAQHAAEEAERQATQRAAEEAERQATQRAAEAAERQTAQRAAEEADRQATQRAHEEAERQAAEQALVLAAKLAEERAARLAEHLAALQAAQKVADQAALHAAFPPAPTVLHQPATQPITQQPAWQQSLVDRLAAAAASVPAPINLHPDPPPPRPPFNGSDYPGFERMPPGYVPPMRPFFGIPSEPSVAPPVAYPIQPPFSQTSVPAPAQPQEEALNAETVEQQRNLWAQANARESAARPAWLMPGRAEASLRETPIRETPIPATPIPSTPIPDASQPALSQPHVPSDSLQGSRDRLASRWFALSGVFETGHAPVEAAPAPVPARAPVMAVFSLAGGVGKTSIVATLGRALSARGERVLLVDTAAFGLLPFFFGARDQRPGLLRTFSPPGITSDAPIQLVTIDPESLGPEPAGLDPAGQNGLSGEIGRYARGGISRVLIDLATASGATTRRLLRMAPMILVPVIPDMNSVVSVSSIDDFFEHNSPSGTKVHVYYVMNQFDSSLPLHLDIREVLREQLGDRLLPFVLRRTPAVGEALAEGMTVIDYAPSSTVTEDFGTLAGWVKSFSAPASTTYRGVRWSER